MSPKRLAILNRLEQQLHEADRALAQLDRLESPEPMRCVRVRAWAEAVYHEKVWAQLSSWKPTDEDDDNERD